MNSKAAVLELRGVTFSYAGGSVGTLSVLEDVSLRLGQGEIVALVGPSGSGKSTLLNLVAGLRQPSVGDILVRGELRDNRLGLFSYMPQRDLLLPWRTALDNSSLLVEVRGAPREKARRAARNLLERFELRQFEFELPSRLSGGMRQRIALIRTFLPEGDVLLDEPFGALDAITRTELQEWLLGLQAATKRSVLLVTHDLEEAIFLADRVYLLSPRPGRIVLEMPIPLGRPRNIDMTTTLEFGQLKARLWQALKESSKAVGAAA